MRAPTLVAVLVPSPAAASTAALDATLGSVRADAARLDRVVGLAADGRDPSLEKAGVTVLSPGEAIAAGDVLAFIRAGDRWRSGALEARSRTFLAHPTAVVGVAGHVRVADDGTELRVPAPRSPIDSVELLLHRTVELSAVLVRTACLDEDALRLILRPFGDAVVWSRLARDHGIQSSGELAADVSLDVERHGTRPDLRLAELLEVIAQSGALGDGEDLPGTITLRRELLRRLYVEPDGEASDADLSMLLPRDPSASQVAAVIADLQWALERQRDALVAERIPWPRGEVAEEDAIDVAVEEELIEVRGQLASLGAEVVLRDAKIRRLEAEVYRRDAIIANQTDTQTQAPS